MDAPEVFDITRNSAGQLGRYIGSEFQLLGRQFGLIQVFHSHSFLAEGRDSFGRFGVAVILRLPGQPEKRVASAPAAGV